MAVAFVRDHVAEFVKTLGSTDTYATTLLVPAGNTLVAVSVHDTAAAANSPTITSISKPAGETASWVFIGRAMLSSAGTAGGSANGEMWAIKTTVDWPNATNLTFTYSASITMKAQDIIEFSGVETTLASTTGTVYNGFANSATVSTTGTAPAIGDLAVGLLFTSNAAAAVTGSSNTTGGSWSSVIGVGSTGGNATTNNFGSFQYKILTAASHQTYTSASATQTGNNGSIVAVLRASVVVTTHAGAVAMSAPSTMSVSGTVIKTGPFEDPSSLSGLASWYDASDDSTFTYSSGAVVSQWQDKSGLGRHLGQVSPAMQPSRSGTQNGKATVVFDGTDDYLDTAPFTVPQPLTVFLALSPGSDPLQGLFSSVGGELQTWIGNGTLSYYAGTAVNVAPSLAVPQTLVFTFNGASSTIHRDGTLLGTHNVGTTGTTTGFRLAERNLTADYYPSGAYFEVVVYDRVLSATERGNVENYLNTKWFTVAGPVEYQAAVVMTAASSLSTTAVRTTPAAVTMTATSSTTAAATVQKTYAGAVTMTAPSTTTSAGVKTQPAAVTMSAPSSTAAAAGVLKTYAGTAVMTAPSALTTDAVREVPAAVSMTAPSVMAAEATSGPAVPYGTYRTHGSYRAHRSYRSQPSYTGPVPVFRYYGSHTVAGSTANRTWTAVPIGPATPNRTVIVQATGWSGGARSVVSATIGGIAATADYIQNSSLAYYSVFRATVPTGEIADVIVTCSDNTIELSIGVWTVDGDVAKISQTYAMPLTGATTLSVQVPSTVNNGFLLSGFSSRSTTSVATWVAASERYKKTANQPVSGADKRTFGSANIVTVNFSLPLGNTQTKLGVISYGPPATVYAAAVNMTAASVLAAAAGVSIPAAAGMTAASTLTVSTVRATAGAVSMTAPSVATITADRATAASATMTAPSTLVSGAVPTRLAAAAMTAASVLTSTAVRLAPAAVDMQAPSALVAAAVRTTAAAASMTANSVLSAGATAGGISGVQMTSPSLLTAGVGRDTFATVTMTAPSILAAVAIRATSADVSMTASSVTTVAGLRATPATVAMTTASVLTSNATPGTGGYAAMTAPSVLTAVTSRTTFGVVSMTAPSALSTAGVRTTTATVNMLAASVLQVAAIRIAQSAVEMAASSTLTATATRIQLAAVMMQAASVLGVNAVKFTPTGSPFWLWDGAMENPLSAKQWNGVTEEEFTDYEIV